MGEVQFLFVLELELVVNQLLLVFVVVLVVLLGLETEVVLLGDLLALGRGEPAMGSRMQTVFGGGVAGLQESHQEVSFVEDHLRSLGRLVVFFLGRDENVVDVVQESLREGNLLQTF